MAYRIEAFPVTVRFSSGREKIFSMVCAGEEIGLRGVIKNVGASRSLLITVTVQLKSTTLVSWKSIYHTSASVTSM